MNLSVSALLRYLKDKLDSDGQLQNIVVNGEISNFHRHQSGHLYFSLKDESAAISCVMFRYAAASLNFMPANGDAVVVKGNISIFMASGQLQLYVTQMRMDGIGALFLRYENLKKALSAQGLFNDEHKKIKPLYPLNVAVLVGDKSAAMSDIKINFAARWPLCNVDYYPVLVQGNEAAKDIITTLSVVDKKGYDAIILARGGGSFEDLFCFNDEELAYAIYNLQTFIITGIGHEQDFTIADFVSDMRAPTPTGAVVILTPNISDVLKSIDDAELSLRQNMQRRLDMLKEKLERLKTSRVFTVKNFILQDNEMRLDYLKTRLYAVVSQKQQLLPLIQKHLENIKHRVIILYHNKNDYFLRLNNDLNSKMAYKSNLFKERLSKNLALLKAYSYENILRRGYALPLKDGKVINSVNSINLNEDFELQMHDGRLLVTYKEDISDGERKI